ncbi:hypothetical protein Tco_0478826 [Tanacetum coccineum]
MKTMTETTLEEYVNKTRGDYYSGITRMMINGKAAYELKGKFLADLQNKAFSGTNGEDTVEHIERFLKIVDPLDLPNGFAAVLAVLATGASQSRQHGKSE